MTYHVNVIGKGETPTIDASSATAPFQTLGLTTGSPPFASGDGTAWTIGWSGSGSGDYALELTRAKAAAIAAFVELVPKGATTVTMNSHLVAQRVDHDDGSFGILLG